MTYIAAGVRHINGPQEPIEAMNIAPFRSKVPWFGADLQTLRNAFRPPAPVDKHYAAAALSVPLEDGKFGALTIAVDHPKDGPSGKCLVLCHGLGGTSDSSYMCAAASYFLEQGYSVYRINMRGSGLSKETAPAPYSGGLTADYCAVLKAIEPAHYSGGLYLMGFSLGGQLMLRTLGEGKVDVPVAAAFSVSAPLNLASASDQLNLPRNKFYLRYLVENMNRDLAHLLPDFDEKPPKSVMEYDDRLIAPFMGFRDAAAYYAGASCIYKLDQITVPLMALHAADDPWIPAADYHGASWAAGSHVLITDGGGHVGFHSRSLSSPWHNQMANTFFAYI